MPSSAMLFMVRRCLRVVLHLLLWVYGSNALFCTNQYRGNGTREEVKAALLQRAGQNFPPHTNISGDVATNFGYVPLSMLFQNISEWAKISSIWFDIYGTRGPTMVGIEVDVYNLFDVSTKDGSFWADVGFRLEWADCRLAFDSVAANFSDAVFYWTVNDVWYPRIEPLRVRDIVSLGHDIQIISTAAGDVAMEFHVLAKFFCNMDLSKLPFDNQHCDMTFIAAEALWAVDMYRGRYGPYDSWTQYYKDTAASTPAPPGEEPMNTSTTMDPEWVFSNFQTSFELFTSRYVVNSLGGATQPHTTFVIHFDMTRKSDWYITGIVLPCVVMWIVSYLAFWVDPNSVPGRIALVVTPILIIINIGARAYSTLPIISSTWLTNYIFTVMSLCSWHMVQFGVVHYSLRHKSFAWTSQPQAVMEAAGDGVLSKSQATSLPPPQILPMGQIDFYPEVEMQPGETTRLHPTPRESAESVSVEACCPGTDEAGSCPPGPQSKPMIWQRWYIEWKASRWRQRYTLIWRASIDVGMHSDQIGRFVCLVAFLLVNIIYFSLT
mmetsp:Transcript_114408/g.198984  ORF Transcript_114408/g.198984 Transcript_114408/m.198984 type:complete len:549 (-) Transcript_114408:62-1708(-)